MIRQKEHIRPVRKKRTQLPGKKRKKKEKILPYKPARANHLFGLFFFLFAWVLYGNTIATHSAADTLLYPRMALLPVPIRYLFQFEQWAGNCYTLLSHGINVLMYGFLSMLVFFTLKRLLKDYNILFPFLIALLFMVHPLHTEVVANLNYRGELLGFTGGMACLWLMLNYLAVKNSFSVVAAMAVFATGYLCSPSILVFLLLFPLVFRFFSNAAGKTFLSFYLPVFIIAMVCHFLLQNRLVALTGTPDFTDNPLFGSHENRNSFSAGWVTLLFYLRMLFYTFPLLFYYGYDTLPLLHPSGFRVILSILIFSILFFIALSRYRSKGLFSFSIVWFLAAILPYSNFFFPLPGIVGERYALTASFGFSMAMITLIFLLVRTDPKSLTIEMDVRLKIFGLLFVLLLPAGIHTLTRNQDWRNQSELLKSDIPHLEKSVNANRVAGNYYLFISDTARGILYLEKAAWLWPDSACYIRLSNLLESRGETHRSAYYRDLARTLHP